MNTEATNNNPVGRDDTARAIRPVRLAHFVLRTSNYDQLVNWYKTILNATSSFANEMLTFLTYDSEHHRVAILNIPELKKHSESVAGVHHVAFTYSSLTDLMDTFERLKNLEINPVFVINHGPTTSLYYEDPDGNQIELQVENYDTLEESTAFFYSPEFAENPIGVEFDPEEILQKLRSGIPEKELKARPRVGKRGLADIKLH